MRSPVAKNMNKVNRPATHQDRTKYNRKKKNNALRKEGISYCTLRKNMR